MEDLLNHDRIKDNAIEEKSCQREQKNAIEDMNRMCSISLSPVVEGKYSERKTV